MTEHKHLKALIRSRMAKTGESYTIARMHLVGADRPLTLDLVATIEAHDKHCSAVLFTPDGSELLSGGFGGQARIWSTSDWSTAGSLDGHESAVTGFAMDRTGRQVVTASSDRTVRVWDRPSRAEISTLGRHTKQAMSVDVSGDGALVATAGHDGKVRVWEVGTGAEHAVINLGGRLGSVAFHPTQSMIAVATVGPELRVMTPEGETVVVLDGPPEASTTARWSADGEFLVASGTGGVVQVWDVEHWELTRKIDLPDGGWGPVALSADSRLMAVGWANHVGLWKASADDPDVVVDRLPKGVYALDFSPDSSLLAMGAADGRVRVWRVG